MTDNSNDLSYTARLQTQSLEAMSRKQLADALEAHRLLIKASQERADAASKNLVEIARVICGAQLDRMGKTNQDLDKCSPNELSDLILGQVSLLRIDRAMLKDGKDPIQELAARNKQIEDLKREGNQLRIRIAKLEAEIQGLRTQNAVVEKDKQDYRRGNRGNERSNNRNRSYSAEPSSYTSPHGTTMNDAPVPPGDGTQTAPPASANASNQPSTPRPIVVRPGASTLSKDQFEAWWSQWMPEELINSGTKDEDIKNRLLRILVFVGETGLSRAAAIYEGMKNDLGRSRATVYNDLKALEDDGLLAQTNEGTAVTGGNIEHYLVLTELGAWLYTKLMHRQPAISEYQTLMKAHKGTKHINLIMKVADAFENLGYKVERQPQRYDAGLDVNGKPRVYDPDLIAVKGNELLFIEVERSDTKDVASDDKDGKWARAQYVGAGYIHVVTDTTATLNTVVGRVQSWARRVGKRVIVRATDYKALTCARPDDIWTRYREYDPTA